MQCQDVSLFRTIGRFAVGIVADGAGSRPNSQVGARLAAEATAALLERHPFLEAPPSDEAAALFSQQVLKCVVATLEDEAEQSDLSIREFDTTLVAFLVAPDWVLILHVGDGFAVVRSVDEETYRSPTVPFEGEHVGETVFVTMDSAGDHCETVVVRRPIQFIAIGSDGPKEVLVLRAKNEPGQDLFGWFEAQMSELSEDEIEVQLGAFMESADVRARVDDDQSLVMCVRTQASDGPLCD